LGSTQHLKNLYGAGYTLEVKLKHIEALSTTHLDNQQLSLTQPIISGTATGTILTTENNIGNNKLKQQENDQIISDHINDSTACLNMIQPTSIDVTTPIEQHDERSQQLRTFVATLFPDACLEESFADRLVYSVPQNAVSSLAQCFACLEKGFIKIN